MATSEASTRSTVVTTTGARGTPIFSLADGSSSTSCLSTSAAGSPRLASGLAGVGLSDEQFRVLTEAVAAAISRSGSGSAGLPAGI